LFVASKRKPSFSLIELLTKPYQMLIRDLRRHGKSGDLSGPYDVPQREKVNPVCGLHLLANLLRAAYRIGAD
jgi:hypothetical protein